MSERFDQGGRLGDQIDLVGIGEVMVLLQPDPPETLADSATWRVHVAGAEFNACAAAASLGARAVLCTRLGNDPPAQQIRRTARTARVELLDVLDAEAPTGLFLKDALPDGERRVHYYRTGSAASRMDESDAERALVAGPRALLVSGLTAALGEGPARAVVSAARGARGRGAMVALDVNLRPGLGRMPESVRAVRDIIQLADVVVIGASEGSMVFGTADPEWIATAVREAGAAEVVVTDGPRGNWWQTRSGAMRRQDSLAEEVVDPVGAGDAFTGGYLAGRLSGLSPGGASWLGSALAAAVVGRAGDIAGLPAADDAARLRERAAEHEAMAE